MTCSTNWTVQDSISSLSGQRMKAPHYSESSSCGWRFQWLDSCQWGRNKQNEEVKTRIQRFEKGTSPPSPPKKKKIRHLEIIQHKKTVTRQKDEPIYYTPSTTVHPGNKCRAWWEKDRRYSKSGWRKQKQQQNYTSYMEFRTSSQPETTGPSAMFPCHSKSLQCKRW